ncbi:DUF2306 domain-containing protein [Agromyces sp. NPDC052230]|uniref:DUF2306 domain-containing protein n=1 Tax=Agromyces sp. NPDC052230 TaxID=3155172 RepID=UPI00343AA2AE
MFASIRAATDLPQLLSARTADPGSFEARYVDAPWLAYLHIIPGVVYLMGAPMQLWRGFRERHLDVHRIMGRIVLPAGIISGVFALAFGVPFSFGGAFQSLATAVFGSWFLLCLLIAYAAIRRRDVQMHRRWMIRAFAVGIGVGTIRLWIGLLTSLSEIPVADSFALAFWLGLGMNVVAGELWVAMRGRRSLEVVR